MNTKENQELSALIEQATAGDKAALETVLADVQDLVFNLSLRMLGTFHDAEDASQDILLKVMTHLSSFKGESTFTTWVFRIAANHLKDYKKHMFAQFPLSFEFYGDDIRNGKVQDVPDLTQNVEKTILAEELKLSCTNVMLQCLDPESRCIFILGTMFRVDSRIAGDILNIENKLLSILCLDAGRGHKRPAAAPVGGFDVAAGYFFKPERQGNEGKMVNRIAPRIAPRKGMTTVSTKVRP